MNTDPWGCLADLVTGRVRRAHRAGARRRGETKQLTGIAAASSRRELDPGDS